MTTDSKMIKDFLIDGLRYLFDGALIAIIWTWNHVTILNIDNLWVESFGNYADTAKKIFQVILTLIIVVTAFYRMRSEILKYRQAKKDSKEK